MSEWWTYRPSDFLMFAPQTWWRLFELHNLRWWPLHLPLVAAGLAALVGFVMHRPGVGDELGHRAIADIGKSHRAMLLHRLVAAGLAALWAWVAWAFMLQWYAPINWAAHAFAAGFILQSIGLLALATLPAAARVPVGRGRRWALGLALWSAALLAYPLLAPAAGQPWLQAQVFGLAPDPTAIATLGWLLLWRGQGLAARALWGGLVMLALAWCAISAATLWTMGSAQGWLPCAAVVLALLAWRSRDRPGGSAPHRHT